MKKITSNMLQPYIVLTEFLGKALGPDYEVALHDLTSKHQSLIAIANGHISGRKIGSPLTNAALHMLSTKAYETGNYLCNYSGIAENGHMLRSSTMFIRDPAGTPVGLLCINFDDSRFQELHEKLLAVVHPNDFLKEYPGMAAHTMPVTENFPMDIPSLMQKIFDDATLSLNTPINRLNQEERKDIIVQLNEQGLFQLKGAISFVAKKFSCSTATIYRYLSEISS